MAAKVKAMGRPERTFAHEAYLPALVEGMRVTLRHFFRNVISRKDTVTVEYPEQKVPYPARFRGAHRLMTREDGRVRCTACMCCATVCPARAITIVAGESDDRRIEKFPARFEIDELRCIFCGLCVEACPCDAIRMDTAEHMNPVYGRADALLGKEELLRRTGRSTAVQGGRFGAKARAAGH